MTTKKEKAMEIVDVIYTAYASGTSILFGIPPTQRSAVESVVIATLRCLDWSE